MTDQEMQDAVSEAGLDWQRGFDLDGENRYAKLVRAVLAAAQAKPAHIMDRDYIDGINITDLQRALTWFGVACEESHEWVAAKMAEHINGLTYAVLRHKEAFDAERSLQAAAQAKPAVPDVDVPRLITAARMVTQYRLMMSYNESYFGEPSGVFKQRVAELERALPPIYPVASISAPPHSGGE